MNSSTPSLAAGVSHDKWIPLLELATREVFELMLSCQLSAAGADAEAPRNITAMVGLAGQLCGVLTLRCDAKSATLMTSKMLGVAPEQVGEQLSDAIGEICNMVAGNFKNKIAGLGDGCMLSPPTVITGTDYSMHSLTDAPALEVKLLFEGAPILISLEIHG
ncbi:MAG TPA: chemotaxis protein CheX [Terriglobales bacterium]|jgi:chemotaxis protein CheX|nr:chemotaxis protein CheX [Terriglobales bacterium]